MRELRNPTIIDPWFKSLRWYSVKRYNAEEFMLTSLNFFAALVGLCLMNGDSANAGLDGLTSRATVLQDGTP